MGHGTIASGTKSIAIGSNANAGDTTTSGASNPIGNQLGFQNANNTAIGTNSQAGVVSLGQTNKREDRIGKTNARLRPWRDRVHAL
ncbi:MAG: hypothetical protein JO094_11250 [Hyphomicrobiales bacterium]|nr:hypothetical protein [Hyphomicrobiales bacterium]MBV9751171.1 hypothetical protein [Hyphomicrobiales bacterium]